MEGEKENTESKIAGRLYINEQKYLVSILAASASADNTPRNKRTNAQDTSIIFFTITIQYYMNISVVSTKKKLAGEGFELTTFGL
jgi:hypothetical protein